MSIRRWIFGSPDPDAPDSRQLAGRGLSGANQPAGNGFPGAFDPNAWADRPEACLLVISDTHGSCQMLEQVLACRGAEIDLILHLGDHTAPLQEITCLANSAGHADSANRANPAGHADCANSAGSAVRPLLGVAGNCDRRSDNRSGLPESLRLTVAGRRLFLTHGHRFGVKHGLDELAIVGGEEPVAADLILFGHTHQYHDEERTSSNGRRFRLFNPGAAAMTGYGPAATCALIRLTPGDIEAELLTADAL